MTKRPRLSRLRFDTFTKTRIRAIRRPRPAAFTLVRLILEAMFRWRPPPGTFRADSVLTGLSLGFLASFLPETSRRWSARTSFRHATSVNGPGAVRARSGRGGGGGGGNAKLTSIAATGRRCSRLYHTTSSTRSGHVFGRIVRLRRPGLTHFAIVGTVPTNCAKKASRAGRGPRGGTSAPAAAEKCRAHPIR